LGRLRLHGLTFVIDAAAVALSFSVALAVRFLPGEIPASYIHDLLLALPFVVLIYLGTNYLFGIHRRMWQYAGMPDIRSLLESVTIATLIVAAADVMLPLLVSSKSVRPLPLSTIFVGGVLSLMTLTLSRLWTRLLKARPTVQDGWDSVLIVGAGQGGQLVAAELQSNPHWCQYPAGFVDDDPSRARRRIHGIPVLGTLDELPEIVAKRHIDIIGVAIPSASTKQLDRILAIAQETSARIQVLPDRIQMMSGQVPMRLRDINVGDILDRVPVEAEQEDCTRVALTGRAVLITGAAGSIGSELVRQVLRFDPTLVLAVDNNETGLFHLERELESIVGGSRLVTVLGDVTDESKMAQVFREHRPSTIFHAAAYKHVPMLEVYPEEAVFVNVKGTLNMCRLAAENRCERFVFISTDKAVNPVNVLGFSKRLGELITRAHEGYGPIYCSVRFGNVVGSRGSALPEFIRQIDAGGPVQVTHPDVERYFMTIPEAVSLVIQASGLALGSELFMLDMGEPVKIDAIARRMIRIRGLRIGSDIEIVYTGLRPGEKLKEELVFQGERTHSTANKAIVSVEDDGKVDLSQLETQVNILMNLAARGEPEVLKASLAQAASNDVLPRLRHIGSMS
jgi:FlaA1/EpsC-like NDP-sugar epimerase